MAFRDCILSALTQGAITREEADDLLSRFEQKFAQARLALPEDAAKKAAREALEKELRAEAHEARRVTLLQISAHDRLKTYLQGFRDYKGRADVFEAVLNTIENYGYAGTSSVAGHAKSIISLVHGEIADVLFTFRRAALTGRRFNMPLADDVVREMLGTATGKAEAKTLADEVASTFEALRQRFNAAGGAIGKIDGGYMPQTHDSRAVLAAGRDGWKDYITPKLDLDRMRDPLTLEPLTPARLDQTLNAAWDNIVTGGWSRREPSALPQRRGMLAGQRAEHRFLHFKNADTWLAYNRDFGKGDPIQSIFDHINGMARDIAAMEILGPNPSATVEWMKQVVQAEAAKAITGAPTLFKPTAEATLQDKINYYPWRIDAVWHYVRGREVVSNSKAIGFGSVRNMITSAVLGSASMLAATTDPFIDMSARHLSGLPITKALWGITKTLSKSTREQAVRSGIIMNDFLHVLGDHARYAGQIGGSEWSRWLADRTLTLSGLEPITEARRHVFALDFQGAIADHATAGFDELPRYLKRTMEGYGLDRTAWDVIRSTQPHAPEGGAGFIRPIDVAHLADGPALPKIQKALGIDAGDAARAAEQTRAGVGRIAEQYLEMILGQTERAVPTGTARARSFVTGVAARGSLFGEIMESGLQFKSFGLSFTTLQFQALMHELHEGPARGAAYASAIALGLTLGGGLALQLKNIANGKDAMSMDDPRFWMQALQTGGGFGVMGDFLFADVTRFGHSFGEQLLGPTVGMISDATKLTLGNVQKAIHGKKTSVGRDTVNFAGRYTPGQSIFYVRAAYRRVFLDQLQYLADPEAHKRFREQENRLRRETRQGFWWRPGQTAPDRPPRLTQ